jgi:hypothetical protein
MAVEAPNGLKKLEMKDMNVLSQAAPKRADDI